MTEANPVARVLVLGPGGSGKSTFACALGLQLRLPVVELDRVYWDERLTPRPAEEWEAMQRRLIGAPRWILDGDLGPYDALDVRLRAADTVVLLDFPLWRCAWRSWRRSRERPDYWRWLASWRRRYRGPLRAALEAAGPSLTVHAPRNPRQVEALLRRLSVD